MLNDACRRAIAGLMSLAVASLQFLPLQHLHAGRANDGHLVSLVHRHLATYQPASREAVSLDHAGDEPQWLDDVFIRPSAARHVQPAASVVSQQLPIRPKQDAGRAGASVKSPLIHGPPLGPPGLRGPPATLYF